MKEIISKEDLQKRIQFLATIINKEDFNHRRSVVFVGVLNGAFMFFSDLVKKIELPIEIDFVRVKSYDGQNRKEIKKTLAFHKDYHYKPVWDGTEENLKEIEEYRIELNVPKNKTYIMPAGDTRDTLIEMYPKVFELCAEHGYNMTGRDHIIAFDTERGV